MPSKKYILKTNFLKIGDVICTRNEEPTSRIIRGTLSCDYSHVLLYVADSSCIHADGFGVHSINTQRLLQAYPNDFKVLRHKALEKLGESFAVQVCKYARSKIGTEYSRVDAAKSGIARKTKRRLKIETRFQFCSRLIAESFSFAGIAIFENPALCTPADILDSNAFEEVTDVVREASVEEIEFAENEEKNSVSKQTAITNFILNGARGMFNTKEIQSIEDLYKWVADHPQSDEDVCKLFEKSGYLTIWADDLIKCPWRYFRTNYQSAEAIQELTVAGLIREKNMAEQDIERFNEMRISLTNLYASYPRDTFFQQVNLYQVLVSLALQRLDLFDWLLAMKSELYKSLKGAPISQ